MPDVEAIDADDSFFWLTFLVELGDGPPLQSLTRQEAV